MLLRARTRLGNAVILMDLYGGWVVDRCSVYISFRWAYEQVQLCSWNEKSGALEASMNKGCSSKYDISRLIIPFVFLSATRRLLL